ncbi:hypothetical protein BHE74_00011283 [Ensete ventricosum]|nr:hypothetical protein BHE74_00011283 [Ensete ventricosum]
MDSGDEQDVPDSQRRKKRYHRHTPRQIQELEAYALLSSISFALALALFVWCARRGYGARFLVGRMFKVCPHPDEKQRAQLSRDLGLEPRQIKFWFQNRRTQMKATARCSLLFLFLFRSCSRWNDWTLTLLLPKRRYFGLNDKIRCENIAMREAMKNVICPSCGAPPASDDSYFDEQKLRMENARLKEEVTSTSLSSNLFVGGDLSVWISPSLDLDLLCRNSSSAFPYTFPAAVSELEKPLMMEMATGAMEEVIRLVQADEPLWVKSGSDGRDILQLETYDRMFQRSNRQLRFPDTQTEASRDSAIVIMNATALIDMFMDAVKFRSSQKEMHSPYSIFELIWIMLQSKWAELFPTIISKARTIEVLAAGMAGSRSGYLILVMTVLKLFS